MKRFVQLALLFVGVIASIFGLCSMAGFMSPMTGLSYDDFFGVGLVSFTIIILIDIFL